MGFCPLLEFITITIYNNSQSIIIIKISGMASTEGNGVYGMVPERKVDHQVHCRVYASSVVDFSRAEPVSDGT